LSRGFAISGLTEPERIRSLATAAERLGYDNFWITVRAGETDPVAVAAAALEATERVEVGLGLIPLDAFPAGPTARSIAALPMAERVVVGLGVGGHVEGAAPFWSEGATQFKASAPDLKIAVGSYGPQVLARGGALADAVLLNWMTPERVRWAVDRVDGGAEAVRRKPPRPVYVLVPTAIGPAAREAVDAALLAMRARAYHRRHQEEMGAAEELGLAVERPGEDFELYFRRYGASVPVVWPVAEPEEDRLRESMQALAPSSDAR
jgi:alkanesulfonate monooxygenase SsuD/methylene tetrahydromethanopterin reductase-like flavin-dependent oxidoreductase (luciferase family)